MQCAVCTVHPTGNFVSDPDLVSNEELILGDHREASGTWERDWESMVRGSVEADQPCYILFRTDELDGSNGYKWVLISWSPDSASVRFKMLYASTKATLKKDFGSGHISDDYYANTMVNISEIHPHPLLTRPLTPPFLSLGKIFM